jgi:hypothetical protein
MDLLFFNVRYMGHAWSEVNINERDIKLGSELQAAGSGFLVMGHARVARAIT